MTEPRTRPEHVSNTRTLLPAWMFASVRIWASVSYRRWLHHTETNRTSNLLLLLKTQFCPKKKKKPVQTSRWLTRSSPAHDRGTSLPGCDRMVLEQSLCFHIWEWHKIRTGDKSGELHYFLVGGRLWEDSLFLFLLDVLVLSIFSLIFECCAVIYKLLNDFLWRPRKTHLSTFIKSFWR